MKETFNIPKEALETLSVLESAGFEAYLVGGCVRDLVLGREPKDWDVATDATPEEISALFEHSYYENDFGTVGVVFEEAEDPKLRTIEVTTYRTEGVYSDKRRPDAVKFTKKLKYDLTRRDFTLNALAFRPLSSPSDPHSDSHESTSESTSLTDGELVDPFHGIEDIERELIRAVGVPDERFAEDALRIMRAVRFAAQLNFAIDPKTQEAISAHVHDLHEIAIERIRDEFSKIIDAPYPSTGLFLMERLGLLYEVLPEFEPAIGMDQNQAHAFTVWEHLLRSLEHATKKNYPFHVKLAAFFHDIGKAYTREKSQKKDDWTFYGHDVVGARMTKKILARLKYPKDTVEIVSKLVRYHMFFSDTDEITHSAVRRMVRNVGKENVENLLQLRRADRMGTGRPKESPYRLRKYESMIDEVLRDPLSVSMLKIDGETIMKLTDSAPGRHIGYILHALLEEVLDDPTKNTKEYLKNRAVELYSLPEKELEKLGKQGKETRESIEEEEVSKIRKKHWVK